MRRLKRQFEMGVHEAFINTPICSILEEAALGLRHLRVGASSIPLADYILQTVFMKMTGFQEQKCKCIVWELATIDYDYRYKILRNGLGECSDYDDKLKVLKALCERMSKPGAFSAEAERKALIQGMRTAVLSFHEICSHLGWFDRAISVFNVLFKSGWESAVAQNTGNFFSGDIALATDAKTLLDLTTVSFKPFYESVVYRHRNRCAHNTTSYHGRHLSLEVLAAKANAYENYLVRFGILILIDDIMRKTFDVWQSGQR